MGWSLDTVREFRERLDMDQGELARLLGVDTRTIGRWEMGKASPTGPARAIIDGISAALDLNPSRRETMVLKIKQMNTVGGVAYMITRLMDKLAEKG